METITIETPCGTVKGRKEDGVCRFLGIGVLFLMMQNIVTVSAAEGTGQQ